MDPLVQAAIATMLGTIIVGFFGWRSTRRVEQSKTDAVEATNAMQILNSAFDGLKHLNDANAKELVRLEAIVKSQRAELDNLNAELRAERRETRPPHLRTRRND